VEEASAREAAVATVWRKHQLEEATATVWRKHQLEEATAGEGTATG
jgi:hypothetical protein